MADQPTDSNAARRVGVPRVRRPRLALAAAAAAATAGLLGLATSVAGVVTSIMPRHFSPAEQRRIMAWEIGKRWRTWPAGQIFPARVSYTLPGQVLDARTGLTLPAWRVGIAPQAPCAAAADEPAALVLARYGCTAVLRATYADATGALVTTVGIAVLRGAHDAVAAQRALPAFGALRPGLRALAFPGTLTTSFADPSRQVAASIAAGPYLVMYTAGYADGRPHLARDVNVYADNELLSVSAGIAGEVARRIAAPPVLPRCPGAPGC